MKRLTILCAALTAAMFMNMSAYAGTSEVAAEVSADTVCLPGADLTDVMGSGFIFSDQHPEITDPEYYLKEWYNSPEEREQSILNVHGEYKTPYNNYMDEAYPLLQEFLHSFDWIHADEYTRYQKAFERVGAAYHGNVYDADAGYISIGGERMADMNEKKLTAYRRKHLGYVFQMYNLIPNLTVRENIEVGAYLSDRPLDVDELLQTLGLYEHRKKLPNQLSGGQQQRTAIGRAIVKNPDILLCDEPTGALDYNTSKDILELIERVNQKYGNTVIMVTHNDAIKDMADIVIRLRDGAVRKSYRNEKKIPARELDW